MLWIARNDLIAADVAQIVLENVLGEQVDQSLDVHGHVLLCLCLFQLTEV